MKPDTLSVRVGADADVTTRLYPAKPRTSPTLILAHGAGADQRSPFIVALAGHLSQRGVAVVTFDFLYIERGKRAPDRADVLMTTWRSVLASVRGRVRGKLFIGGKSMGGRIASMLAAEPGFDPTVCGLILLGYPMHPPGKPDQTRTTHLTSITCPILFVQGSRDPFGSEAELRPVVESLARRRRTPRTRATIHVVPGGDHSFKVPKKGPPSQADVDQWVEDAIVQFITASAAPAAPPRPKVAMR